MVVTPFIEIDASPGREAAFGRSPVGVNVVSAAPRIEFVVFGTGLLALELETPALETGGVEESVVIGCGPSGGVPGETRVELLASGRLVVEELRTRASDETVARFRLVSLLEVGRGMSVAVGSEPVVAAGN